MGSVRDAMKILQMHADFIEYTPIRKEIDDAEDILPKSVKEEDILVLFTAIERGDDKGIVEKAISDAKEFMERLKIKRLMIYPFAHLSQDLAAPSEARDILIEMEKEAKENGIDVVRAPFGWNKALQIKVKGHPLAEMSRSYTSIKEEIAVKKVAGIKRELSESEMLSRIRKSDFSNLPDHDHRVIGERLDLFSFYEPSPSMVFWHNKGIVLRDILIDMIRRELRRRGYIEISTAPLANVVLWKISGHWEHYKDNMFLTKLGDDDFGLKPMNCPSTILYYKSRKWSYRDLPLRIADFDQLFRKELSGVATGLFRVKVLTQDDAHIFCTDEQVENELNELIDLIVYFYGIFKLPFKAKVSTMPDEHIGDEAQWEKATEMLINALRKRGIEPQIKEKEGAFYGPKIDVDVMDSIGREWQCATIQLDYQLPQRFRLRYTGSDGREHTPVMIHRVIYGSIERFIGIILEHFKGNLPLWLSPIQVKVIPVSDSSKDYAKSILDSLVKSGVRAEIDISANTLSYRIRNAQIEKVPLMLIIGKEEVESGTITVRTREGKVYKGKKLEQLLDEINGAVSSFS